MSDEAELLALKRRVDELENIEKDLQSEIEELDDENEDCKERVRDLEEELADLYGKWNDKGCLLQQIGDLS